MQRLAQVHSNKSRHCLALKKNHEANFSIITTATKFINKYQKINKISLAQSFQAATTSLHG